MDEKDRIYLDDMLRTYERAYKHGFSDGIQFLLDILKDDKILKVFKDGNTLYSGSLEYEHSGRTMEGF